MTGPTFNFIPIAKFSRTHIYLFKALWLFFLPNFTGSTFIPFPQVFRTCMEREAKSKLVFPKNRFRAVVTMEGKGGNLPNQILTEPSKCSPKFADLHTALKLSKQAVKLILNGQLISKRLFGIFHSSKNWTKKFLPNYYGTSSRIVFVHFLEELKTQKRHSKINWPLENCHVDAKDWHQNLP